ncbi:MAG: hypothetical protein V1863_01695 [Candidatus Omnitrophota bacterium]
MAKAGVKYRLEPSGAFVIENYNLAKPWASFFPGIAGCFGIPLWAFYVNRGQCIASVGIRSKDEAILEFLPANKAYQLVSGQGFRTFVKVRRKNKTVTYEPFGNRQIGTSGCPENKMVISAHELSLLERNSDLGLEIEVCYFPLPGEPFGALVREVTFRNLSKAPASFEVLDGASAVVPYGVNNFFLKEMSRTIEAWMSVDHPAGGLAVYKLTTDPRDTAQVAFIRGGHFYAALSQNHSQERPPVVVDPSLVFGPVCDFSTPLKFFTAKAFRCPTQQTAKNKTPCAFSHLRFALGPSAEHKIISLLGHVFDVGDIKKYRIDKMDAAFVSKKKAQNQALIEGVTDRVFTASGIPAFDLYVRQTYLDNVLRGGLPHSVSVGDRQKIVYVFSRKHGDLERDYNRFMISPTFFSEGEGNYRDMNQNRRSDIFFNPLLGEKNIVDFMNLIQLDGYNPLVFRGDRFVIGETDFFQSSLAQKFHERDVKKIAHIVAHPFALGDFLHYVSENKIFLSCTPEELVKGILEVARSSEEAAFGEGYWTDHWTYNTDLLESFQALYPDRMFWLLFEKNDFTYYDTHVFVKPRRQRMVLQHGEVRQYHALGHDEEKNAYILKRHADKNKVRIHGGQGDLLRTTLLEKLLCVVANKLATLDPFGVGVEMEADKPNWYDALNGLPGLFGSSLSETFELKRLILWIRKTLESLGVGPDRRISLIVELYEFLVGLKSLLAAKANDFDFWDKANALKEAYRFKVRRGVAEPPARSITVGEMVEFFELALEKCNAGIAKGLDPQTGLCTTYFTHRVLEYDIVTEDDGKHAVLPQKFEQVKLPLFLEGFVHALRTESDKAKALYQAVKASPLYDRKLKMYKVNASLAKESYELGRAKAFTAGWLENESVWLHMEYKFLLELLKNGLYEEFTKEFFQILVCFQKPSVYGRSILENSSFIVSSVHPDASLHGTGFVARLSGSTAELIHMWRLMNMGHEPFGVNAQGELSLRFRPVLCGRFFTKKRCRGSVWVNGVSVNVSLEANTYTFLFLGRTLVTYHNLARKNTFGPQAALPVRLELWQKDKVVVEVAGNECRAPYAAMVRDGKIDRIDVWLGSNKRNLSCENRQRFV